MKRNFHKRAMLVFGLWFIIMPLINIQAAPLSQTEDNANGAQEVLDRLTPEERVGQLFLVTFQGANADVESQIHDLIKNYYLGGVMLSAENDNFISGDDALFAIQRLVTQLQESSLQSSQEEHLDPITEEAFLPAYIPLFVGINQEGDGAPYDQIYSGLTPLPSQLAIGATWNPELAHQVGIIAGQELNALGINLLLGPSLDVSDTPDPTGEGDLNVRVFGGDPYWVGEFARGYIAGVHEGSAGHIAIIGTHFPGLGSADRLPEEEVATVQKSLEQLQQIELAPFFAVTGHAEQDAERLDGLLVSHIRYQGLQGNIRSTTRPISFDQMALTLLMEQAPIAAWRETGGVVISDDLGSRAVRRFYDPTEQTFNARRLALDAFLAGNDMLYLNNFIADNDPDAYTTIVSTLEFFAQKYREDPVFAQKVDEAVLRILALKMRMYGSFRISLVLPSGDVTTLGSSESRQISFEVAQRSSTLISPPLDELNDRLPNAPSPVDRIAFITDTYDIQQCSECPPQPILAVDALQRAVISLYGPASQGLVTPGYLISHSFEQLNNLLDGYEDLAQIESSIQRSQWLVFIMLNVDPERPTSLALQRLLAERPDLTSNKNIIVFAANAPYYLDATDISKLTAFYGLFGKTDPFMDVAARLLFKEITTPEGNLPVSVPGIGYVLISATSPNPEQMIPLALDLPSTEQEEELVAEPTPIAEYQIGDIVPLRAGVILDHNGHPVPDHTPVQFGVTVNGQETAILSSTTIDGIARISYELEQSGLVAIHATSASASSNELRFEIPVVEVEVPPTSTQTETPTPTLTPSSTATEVIPTLTATATVTATATATSTSTPIPSPETEPIPPSTDLRDWAIAVLITFGIAWLVSRFGALIGHVRRGIRWGLSSAITGLLTYTYTVSNLPGTEWALESRFHWGVYIITAAGALLGWLLGFLITSQNKR